VLRTAGVASAALLAVVAAPAAARTPVTADSAHAMVLAAPDPLTQPLKDGCQRYPLGLFSRTSPEWTYVYNTPASQPPPAPQWVVGTISAYNPKYQAVHTSGGDLPFGHRAYDYNVNVNADPAYQYLLGGTAGSKLGNFGGTGEEAFRLHTEWEDLSVPQFAWGESGDRLTELGSWVWDCGHWGTPTEIANPDYVLPKIGQPQLGCLSPVHVAPIIDTAQCTLTGESTEFHPYRALWDVRKQPATSPYAEAEAGLFVSTDQTLAGSEADCAHKFPPPVANLNYGPDYRLCLQTAPNWQDVSGDYSFLLPAPSRPSADAHLIARAVDRGSKGAPVPTLSAEGDAVRVRFHITAAAGQAVQMAYSVYAGWNQVSSASMPTHLRVSLDRLEVHRAMDPGCTVNAFGLPTPGCPYTAQSTRDNQLSTAPANWNLFFDAGGVWGRWTEAGSPELHMSDGTVLAGTQSVDVYVPQGAPWRFFVHGRECDLGALGVELDCPSDTDLADDNDVQGMILDQYPSATAAVGTHRSNGRTRKADPTSTCPDVNPEGCYSLTYTVSVVHDEASRTGALAALAPAAALPVQALASTGPVQPSPAAAWWALLAAVAVYAVSRRAPGRGRRRPYRGTRHARRGGAGR
jgi:hypothetical protein